MVCCRVAHQCFAQLFPQAFSFFSTSVVLQCPILPLTAFHRKGNAFLRSVLTIFYSHFALGCCLYIPTYISYYEFDYPNKFKNQPYCHTYFIADRIIYGLAYSQTLLHFEIHLFSQGLYLRSRVAVGYLVLVLKFVDIPKRKTLFRCSINSHKISCHRNVYIADIATLLMINPLPFKY